MLVSQLSKGELVSDPPTLILNPREDVDFVALARGLVNDGHRSPERLEAGLRTRYPRARVHARGLSGESRVVWYVYRDGHWIRD
jgi:hypothetical protein